MELVHPESHSMYRVEVSKKIVSDWLFIPVNFMGGLGRFMDQSLPRSSVSKANLKEVHTIIWLMCVIL